MTCFINFPAGVNEYDAELILLGTVGFGKCASQGQHRDRFLLFVLLPYLMCLSKVHRPSMYLLLYMSFRFGKKNPAASTEPGHDVESVVKLTSRKNLRFWLSERATSEECLPRPLDLFEKLGMTNSTAA